MTTFKIPAPWKTGYAIPEYVQKEGLQTRAFVTKWAPRGTYDDPDAFDPSWDHGYAVPEYIKAEGYGQGTFVTEWAPRGTYAGIQKRARRIKQKQAALGDVVMPGPFATYGQRSAATILQMVRRLPIEQRKPVIVKALNAIDPTLYDRSETYARRYINDGVDATTALELGLARAMSEGIGKEIVQIGKSGRLPPARGQVGLGCYGRRALGADIPVIYATVDPSTVQIPVPPTAGQCITRDGGTWVWKTAADGTGFWARASASDTCTSTYTGTAPTTRTGGGGVTVTDPNTGEVIKTPVTTAPEKPLAPMIQVGPFYFPKDEKYSPTRYHSIQLPEDWQAEIKRVITPKGRVSSKGTQLDKFITDPPEYYNNEFFGLISGAVTKPKWKPIVKAKHPVTGKDYGVFLGLSYAYGDKPMNDPANPPILHVFWMEVDKAWYADVWDFIKSVLAKIVDVAVDIVEAVGGVACQLLTSDNAEGAGAAVAAAYGAPPQAGAKGVSTAASACGTQPPAGGGGSGEPGWLLPVAIGGGVIIAAMLLKKKKKRTSP